MKGLKDILLLGDERLYQKCVPLTKGETPEIRRMVADLHNALLEFRSRYHAGRAIAAPQLGYMKRLIYLYLDERPTVFINPEIRFRSEDMMELWDDCMSLPNLLVYLRRHQTIHLHFYDLEWEHHQWELTGDLSELLQHEYDHLDGILCTMRAVNERSFRWRPTPLLSVSLE